MVGTTGSEDNKANSSHEKTTASGPTQCAIRDRASDAAEAVKELAQMMNQMDPNLVKRLVQAREAATNIYKAFPEGDQRFTSPAWESDEGEEDDIAEDPEVLEDEGQSGRGGSADDASGEPCKGLLDDRVDDSADACLERAKKEYDFDIVAEMDAAKFDFFERIRLVNHLRRMVDAGMGPAEALLAARWIIERRDQGVLANDSLLEPFIPGDLLLTVLETEEGVADSGCNKTDDVIHAVQDSLREANILP